MNPSERQAEIHHLRLTLSMIQSRLSETHDLLRANVTATERLMRKLRALEPEPLPGQGEQADVCAVCGKVGCQMSIREHGGSNAQ